LDFCNCGMCNCRKEIAQPRTDSGLDCCLHWHEMKSESVLEMTWNPHMHMILKACIWMCCQNSMNTHSLKQAFGIDRNTFWQSWKNFKSLLGFSWSSWNYMMSNSLKSNKRSLTSFLHMSFERCVSSHLFPFSAIHCSHWDACCQQQHRCLIAAYNKQHFQASIWEFV
jgi:hypothetical protein